MKFEPPYSGTVTIVFQADKVVANRTLSLNITSGELSGATKNNALASTSASTANTNYTLSYSVTAGETYWIWGASQNWSGAHDATACTISSITYTHASDLTTLTLANDTESGAVSVNGIAGVTGCNVQKGEYVKLSVVPNMGSIFGGWKNANDEIVSEYPEIWVLAEDAIALTTTWRTADVHNFVWNPAVASGNWNDSANWLYEGIAPAETYPSDAAQDVAIFDTEATISFTENAAASNIFANADITLASAAQNAYRVGGVKVVGGEGTISLANSGFYNLSSAVISNDICFVEGTTNTVSLSSGATDIRGDFTGTGVFKLVYPNSTGVDARLYGNNNEYYGDVYTSGGKSNRNALRFMHSTSAGTNSYWHVAHSVDMYNDDASGMGSASIGGYDGAWFDRYDGYTITVGYLNRDSAVSIYNGVTGRANNIVKVGTANLTLGTTKIKNLTIEGGSVTMPIGIAPQTLTIATGAKIILVGDAEWTAGTETKLFSYTTLAGTGAGTLAEQVEVTGLAEGLVAKITVEDNTVTATIEAAEVAPTTDDENATITKNGDGSYTVEVAAETVAITVPDGVTVREVVVSPNTATVTGVPASATVKVAVSWTDAQDASQSAAYAIVKVDSVTGAVSLDEDAVVTVGEEEIALKPQLSDAGDEVAPLDVGEDVSVGIKSIPGLVYRLARGTAVDEIDTSAANAIAEEKATSSRVSLVDDDPPADGAFYRVTVEVK